jgi:hypothetical protein
MRKRATAEPLIDNLVTLLHHFRGLGYTLEQVIHPHRLGREHPRELTEAIRRCGLYDYDQAKCLLTSVARRRRRATPPTPLPAPPRLL